MSLLSTMVFTIAALLKIHAGHVHWYHLFLAMLIALVMSVSGDSFDFFVGKYANKLLNHWQVLQKHFDSKKLKKGEALVQKYGKAAIFFSRYIPGIRTVTSYVIGASNYPWLVYVSLNTLANTLMLTLYALLGYFLGGFSFVKAHFVWIVMAIILIPSLPSLYVLIRNAIQDWKK